jgi:isorenieratene synthase
MNNTSNSENFPVVIIGGGLAGLTAAAHLAARGIPPLLLEADSRWPGGRLAGGDPDTFTYKGREWSFPSEHGMHALWGNYHNMRATLERFTQTQLVPSLGEEWINRWGREVRVIEASQLVRFGWVPAPFHYLSLLYNPHFWSTITPLDFLSLPGFLFSILWTVGFDPIKEGVALDGLMMNEFFRGWTPNLRATFTGLAVNLLAAPKEDITLAGIIAALRFYTLLRRDSWQMEYLPDHSHEAVIKPLMDFIENNEGWVIRGAEVQRLERVGESWKIVFVDQARSGLRSVQADQVILATHVEGAQHILLNSPDTADEAARMRFPGMVRNATIRLWFGASPREGSNAGMFTGDFLPDNFFWLHRLFDDFRAFHTETGGSCIEMHLYAGDDVLEQPENVLIIRCVDEVQRAFPELRGKFITGTVRLNSRVQTAFRPPTADTLSLNTPWPNILACGDWTGYDSPSFWMERSVVTAIACANTILKTHNLEPYPIIQTPPPEPLAQGMGFLVRLFRRTLGRVLLGGARAIRRRKE